MTEIAPFPLSEIGETPISTYVPLSNFLWIQAINQILS
jgi:hypothetical protein